MTWVHYVHGAHEPQVAGFRRRVLARFAHAYYARRERAALGRARLVLCNSKRTAQDVHERIGIEAARTRVVYYGSDASQFSLVSEQERTASRRELGWPLDRPVALFVGALGDRRKGFDRLLEAWAILCRDSAWDAHLAVTGHGSELPAWQRRAADLKIAGRITFTRFPYRHLPRDWRVRRHGPSGADTKRMASASTKRSAGACRQSSAPAPASPSSIRHLSGTS